MSKLELVTRQALANLSQQMTEPKAQEFLRNEFALSDKEAHLLAAGTPMQRQHAMQSLALEIQERMKKLRPSELNSYIGELFPSLGENERVSLICMLDEEIPTKGKGKNHPIYILVQQGLESTTLEFDVDEAQRFFAEKFPGMSNEVQLLVQPDMIERHKAVEKVVQALEQETHNRSAGEILDMIAEKLPSLDSAERGKFISALDEEIPPKEK
jgi:hypothetical protein